MDDQRVDREGGGIRYRKLRISWSAVWGTACVLLIVLWVRSYFWSDWVFAFRPSDWHHLRSINGELVLQIIRQPNSMHRWGVASAPASEFLDSPYGWNSNIIRPQHERWGFAFFNSPKISAYAIPIWSFVLLFAALAGAPWIFKISWRFSLRTLLIAMTLVAALLGLLVWAVK
jgi:hypothetical protein